VCSSENDFCMKDTSIQNLIVMGQAEFYPLAKMNANHKRFHYLCTGLSRTEKVLVVCPNNKFKLDFLHEENIQILRIPIINLPLLAKPSFRIFGKYYIHKYLKNNGVIDNFTYWYNSVLTPRIGAKYKCLRIWDIMGIVSNEILRDKKSVLNRLKSKIYLKLEMKVMSQTDIITTINNSHKDILRGKFPGRIEIIRDAVDQNEEFNINEQFYSFLHEKYKNSFVLLFIGSFDRKRIDDLLEAVRDCKLTIPKISLLVVGDGANLNYYKEMAKSYEILDNINFLGYLNRADLNAAIRVSDVCFADVFLEGFPFKVFEYGLFEKPIIVKDTDSIREVLTDDVNSCFYRNSNELKLLVEKLYLSPDLRARLGRNIKSETLKNHIWDKRIVQLKTILND